MLGFEPIATTPLSAFTLVTASAPVSPAPGPGNSDAGHARKRGVQPQARYIREIRLENANSDTEAQPISAAPGHIGARAAESTESSIFAASIDDGNSFTLDIAPNPKLQLSIAALNRLAGAEQQPTIRPQNLASDDEEALCLCLT